MSDAAEGLSNVVRSARTGPFDEYVERVSAIIANIKVTQEEAVSSEAGGKETSPRPKIRKRTSRFQRRNPNRPQPLRLRQP